MAPTAHIRARFHPCLPLRTSQNSWPHTEAGLTSARESGIALELSLDTMIHDPYM
jgi:hypothetical protein